MQSDGQLLPALKQYFGFDSFRPLQEQIILDSLAGRDVFALLPTGGGKSLCFQLPALLRPGITLVVSPLISLMKDQVDALTAGGVPATFLNSSLDTAEQQRRLRRLFAGEYRLLYVAPERVMTPAFLTALRRVDLGLIAIDEAHCISEWGHDFRPEYRQLAALRQRFPDAPVMALTATATERVRADIVQHLRLRQPAVHIGSFNRRNLSYSVVRKQASYAQLLGLIQRFQGESGIVYCGSRAATESLARKLSEDGVNARPYHAGLLPPERSQNQEAFIRDEVPVICATIAFGMGIDKPNVRFVVHYDLPGSIENYYQETGRAGRDGLPSECTLLYSAGDQMKRERFIDEKPDAKEREIARAQLQEMVQYGESLECRRRLLLNYFGEEFPGENCEGCDNCLAPEPTLDAGASARKLLACVEAIRNKSGFGTGLTHVIDVLAGGNTERVRKWGHDGLPAYASGREHSKADWTSIGHELLRRGYLLKNAERFNIIELTREGREALAGRAPLELRMREPTAVFSAKTRDTGGYDPELFQRLRAVRRRLAEERNQPPFVIFSDVALRQMARDYPQDRAAFLRISGVGARKLEEFSQLFLGEIAAHLASHPRLTFESPQPALPLGRASLGDSQRETLRRFRAGETVAEIARARDLALSTVMGHLGAAAEAGEEIGLAQFLTPEQQQEVAAAAQRLGPQNLTALREALGERYDYGVLRLYRAQALRPPAPVPAPA